MALASSERLIATHVDMRATMMTPYMISAVPPLLIPVTSAAERPNQEFVRLKPTPRMDQTLNLRDSCWTYPSSARRRASSSSAIDFLRPFRTGGEGVGDNSFLSTASFPMFDDGFAGPASSNGVVSVDLIKRLDKSVSYELEYEANFKTWNTLVIVG